LIDASIAVDATGYRSRARHPARHLACPGLRRARLPSGPTRPATRTAGLRRKPSLPLSWSLAHSARLWNRA